MSGYQYVRILENVGLPLRQELILRVSSYQYVRILENVGLPLCQES